LAEGAKPIAEMSFEEALKELSNVVDRLERGDVPLEDSIALYERGGALKAHCEAKLKDAELKVEAITKGSNGEATGTRPFDAD
jgi:exodeoxyribonuclease VII small subunit